MLDVEISNIYRLDGQGGLKAFCDIIVSRTFLIKGLGLLEGQNGLFVRMPAKAGKDGKWYESIKPVSKEIREALNETILEAFGE